MFGVSELAQRSKVRANAEDHFLLLAWFGSVDTSLDDVVSELIFHHHHEGTRERGRRLITTRDR